MYQVAKAEAQTIAAAPIVRPPADGDTDDPLIDTLAVILVCLARERAAGAR